LAVNWARTQAASRACPGAWVNTKPGPTSEGGRQSFGGVAPASGPATVTTTRLTRRGVTVLGPGLGAAGVARGAGGVA
jgi:hypothetical protein